MADLAALLAEINTLAAEPPKQPLSLAEKVLGYSRSYLSGPTFNFGDNIEAGITAALTDATYDQELAQIRGEQARFKDQTDYLDNAVEIASGLVLNPLDKLRKAGALFSTAPALSKVPVVPTAINAATSAPGQAFIAGAGAADGEDVLRTGALSAVIGAGASAASTSLGGVLSSGARGADRMKLSAYGIGTAELAKQLKKLEANGVRLNSASDMPIIQTVNKAEAKGIIKVDEDLLTNAVRVNAEQDKLGNSLRSMLQQADGVVPANRSFQWTNTLRYIDSLSGSARDEADKAVMRELLAIESQMGAGRLTDLQRIKVGLNYKHDKNPYTEDIVKSLRSDLKEEIENRVDAAALSGALPPEFQGAIKGVNREWGDLAELQDALKNRAYRDIKGNPQEDLIGEMRTSGGVGTLNNASANSGNPIPAAIGAIVSAARGPTALSATADVLRDPAIGGLAAKIGDVLPDVVTGRSVAQVYNARGGAPGESATVERDRVKSLLAEIEALSGVTGESGSQADTARPKSEATRSSESGSPGSKESSPSSINLRPISSTTQAPTAKLISAVLSPGSEPASLSALLTKTTGRKMDLTEVKALVAADPIDQAVMMMESSGDPDAKNPDSTAGGLFQLIKKTAKNLGVKDVFNPEQNYKGYKKLREENETRFKTSDPQVVYAAHYLGAPLLDKWRKGKDLTEDEAARVKNLREVLLPRFMGFYEQALAALSGQVEA